MEFLQFFFFILVLVFFVLPTIRKQILESRRFRAIRNIEKMRNTRVITLIHRQEALGFLGIPFYRYIDIEDSEKILRAIRLTPKDKPIDIILHTPGGLVLAAEQIAHAIQRRKAKVTVLIPHYAMSGGTLIALAADEIIMDEDAVMGSLDPQLGFEYPASSVIWAVESKGIEKIRDDRMLVLFDVARKARIQLKKLIFEILQDKLETEKAEQISKILTEGKWTHDYPLTVEKVTSLGIPVKVQLPKVIYELMELYPQATLRRPAVEYIPSPYPKKKGQKSGQSQKS